MRCKAQSTAMPRGIASICNTAARPSRVDSTDPISVIQWTSVQMKSRTLLRTASVLTLVHALLNAFAGLLSGTSEAQDEMAVLGAMKALRFDAMGSMRTYWDFYFGFGVFLSANLILLSVVMWQLAALAETAPRSARSFIASLCIGFLVFAALSWRYFFIAPVVVEVIIAVVLGLAYVAARK
jgi:hypothetical protein